MNSIFTLRFGTSLAMAAALALQALAPSPRVPFALAHDSGITDATAGNIETKNPASPYPWTGGSEGEDVSCVPGEWHWNIKTDGVAPDHIHVKFSDGIGWISVPQDKSTPGDVYHYTVLTTSLAPSTAAPIAKARYQGDAPSGNGAHFNFSHGPCAPPPPPCPDGVQLTFTVSRPGLTGDTYVYYDVSGDALNTKQLTASKGGDDTEAPYIFTATDTYTGGGTKLRWGFKIVYTDGTVLYDSGFLSNEFGVIERDINYPCSLTDNTQSPVAAVLVLKQRDNNYGLDIAPADTAHGLTTSLAAAPSDGIVPAQDLYPSLDTWNTPLAGWTITATSTDVNPALVYTVETDGSGGAGLPELFPTLNWVICETIPSGQGWVQTFPSVSSFTDPFDTDTYTTNASRCYTRPVASTIEQYYFANTGNQGCAAANWKNQPALSLWPLPYTTGTSFMSTFEVTLPAGVASDTDTLLAALPGSAKIFKKNGPSGDGDLASAMNNLAKEGVAALLNGGDGAPNYRYDDAVVKAIVSHALNSGNKTVMQFWTSHLQGLNETTSVCPTAG